MTEITVLARIMAREKEAEIVSEAIERLAAATRSENGCLAYEIFVSETQFGLTLIHEIWADQESLLAHGSTDHIARFKTEISGRAEVAVQKLQTI
ncbi:putative quinol monooxygenase [Shimia abyssi]|uniref:Quinol monooxygenase YgiN n=1 Tax=Shimia abyssi TaxID=1662395 RepID=A0A2P8F7Y7_9RHOB|nr:putative quinol monooxygenase [Shimia abyssi]PSL17825.1 quinol monooxygenase YgiN [Shimia abyssi]